MTCLLCGFTPIDAVEWPRVVNRIARNGTPQISVACKRCAFVQADPMPTADELHAYYASGRYRAEFPPLPVAGVQPDDPSYAAACDGVAGSDAEMLMHPQFAGMRAGQSVLEIGSGEGRVAAALMARGLDVTAWDDDPSMRAAASARGVPVSPPHGGRDWLYAMQVLEHMPDPLATLTGWRELVRDGGALHVQVPTLEAMYGGREHFFQWPHVVNFTTRTLCLMLMRAGFSPVKVGVYGTTLCATAVKAEAPLSYDEAEGIFADRIPRDDVPGLIAAHEETRPKPSLLDRWLAGDDDAIPKDLRDDPKPAEDELRAEVARLRDAADLAIDSLRMLVQGYNAEAEREGERWAADPWLWGYQCGKSREASAIATQLSSVVNGLVMRRKGGE